MNIARISDRIIIKNRKRDDFRMDFLKLKSGTDIRGSAVEGIASEPVTLTDEVIEAIAASFLVWC